MRRTERSFLPIIMPGGPIIPGGGPPGNGGNIPMPNGGGGPIIPGGGGCMPGNIPGTNGGRLIVEVDEKCVCVCEKSSAPHRRGS